MNILIIDKSKSISYILKKSLGTYGYNVTEDTQEFNVENIVKRNIFDILILDTNITGKFTTQDILDRTKRIKEIDCKILGLCSTGTWRDKVNFLNHGGDDVLSYPFPMQELVARIQSLLRWPRSYIDNEIYIGDVVLDTRNRTVCEKEKDIDLRRKEYELFEYLVRNKNRIISRCELLDHVWDYRSYTGSNTVDVHVKRIRDKISNKSLIETVHGQGYRIKDLKASSALQDAQNQVHQES
jgi:DNA-binding response OmpR family regulator